jgi:undecaprenol kinase
MGIKIKKFIDVRKQAGSFQNAFRGLKTAFCEEQSFKIQVITALLVLVLMFYFPLHYIERAIILLAIIFVLGLELINSQVERIMDVVQFDHNPKIKAIKDLSASAVLIAAVGALAIGFFIFLPYLL